MKPILCIDLIKIHTILEVIHEILTKLSQERKNDIKFLHIFLSYTKK